MDGETSIVQLDDEDGLQIFDINGDSDDDSILEDLNVEEVDGEADAWVEGEKFDNSVVVEEMDNFDADIDPTDSDGVVKNVDDSSINDSCNGGDVKKKWKPALQQGVSFVGKRKPTPLGVAGTLLKIKKSKIDLQSGFMKRIHHYQKVRNKVEEDWQLQQTREKKTQRIRENMPSQEQMRGRRMLKSGPSHQYASRAFGALRKSVSNESAQNGRRVGEKVDRAASSAIGALKKIVSRNEFVRSNDGSKEVDLDTPINGIKKTIDSKSVVTESALAITDDDKGDENDEIEDEDVADDGEGELDQLKMEEKETVPISSCIIHSSSTPEILPTLRNNCFIKINLFVLDYSDELSLYIDCTNGPASPETVGDLVRDACFCHTLSDAVAKEVTAHIMRLSESMCGGDAVS
eukprot:m.28700 g.28700  ORF g.28700 m.28700 type:complete len:405 (+) comp6079_c0_seq2:48-1262(+)